MIARRAYIVLSEFAQLLLLTYATYPCAFLYEIFIIIFAISTVQSIWTFISTEPQQLNIFQYKKMVLMGLKGILLLFVLDSFIMNASNVRAMLLITCYIMSSILEDYLLIGYTKNLLLKIGFDKQEELVKLNPQNQA